MSDVLFWASVEGGLPIPVVGQTSTGNYLARTARGTLRILPVCQMGRVWDILPDAGEGPALAVGA